MHRRQNNETDSQWPMARFYIPVPAIFSLYFATNSKSNGVCFGTRNIVARPAGRWDHMSKQSSLTDTFLPHSRSPHGTKLIYPHRPLWSKAALSCSSLGGGAGSCVCMDGLSLFLAPFYQIRRSYHYLIDTE